MMVIHNGRLRSIYILKLKKKSLNERNKQKGKAFQIHQHMGGKLRDFKIRRKESSSLLG
jgi:hypothetical protein